MASDERTPLLNLLLQATGNNNNNWGELCNSEVITPLENAIAGHASHTVTGGTLDLSASPIVEGVLFFNGTLAALQTVIVPNLSKTYIIDNQTAGDFGFLMKTSAGTAINIPRGQLTIVRCYGSDVLRRHDVEEVGKVGHFAGSTVPANYMECTGATRLISHYPDLYAKIGTTYGGDGATTFALPDYDGTGRFLRSRTASLAVGTYQSNALKSHNHSASATTSVNVSLGSADGHSHLWSGTTSTANNHDHPNSVPLSAVGILNSSLGAGTNVWRATTTGDTQQAGSHNHTVAGTTGTAGAHSHTASASASTSVTVASTGDTETRPEAAAVIMAIKY